MCGINNLPNPKESEAMAKSLSEKTARNLRAQVFQSVLRAASHHGCEVVRVRGGGQGERIEVYKDLILNSHIYDERGDVGFRGSAMCDCQDALLFC